MSYVFDSTTDPQEQRRRRLLADALMQKGTDTSPILSPWQGAARLSNGLMAGLLMGQQAAQDREDRDYQKGISGELNTFGGGAAPSATTAAIAGKPMGPIKLGGFDSSLGRTLQFEGGVNPSDTNGTPSVNGINQKANPDVDLNRVQSDPAYRASIYRDRYWNPIQADKMDPRLAHVAFDTSVIAGPGKAKELLEKSGGDPETFLKLREDFQNRLLQANPEKYGKYAEAWSNRIATLRGDVGVNPGGMFAVGGGAPAPAAVAGSGGQTTLAGGSDTLQPGAAPAPAAAGGMTPQMRRLMQIATDPRAGKANQEAAKLQLQMLQKETPSYGFTVTPDGTLLRTNPKTGSAEPVGNYAKPDPTTERKNYEADMADRKARGQPDVPYGEWLQNYRKSGAQNLTVDQRQESEEAKVVGKALGERRVAVEGAYTAVPEKLNRVALMQRLTQAIQSGRAAGVQGTIADIALGVGISPKALESVGIDPKLPATSQALDMAVNQATIGSMGQGGFPTNNFSDADREFLRKLWPSIQNRPEANAIILEVHRRAAERQLEAADDWTRAQDSGKTFQQWEREWSQKIRGKDIFADVTKDAETIAAAKPKGVTKEEWSVVDGVKVRVKP